MKSRAGGFVTLRIGPQLSKKGRRGMASGRDVSGGSNAGAMHTRTGSLFVWSEVAGP